MTQTFGFRNEVHVIPNKSVCISVRILMLCVQSLRCAWTLSVWDVFCCSQSVTILNITELHFVDQIHSFSTVSHFYSNFIPVVRCVEDAVPSPFLIEVLPHFYDRDLNNSVTPSLPVDFPLSWNFNLISPKFFLPIIRGTFLLIRFINVSGTLSLFYLSLLICTYLSRVQNWSRASGLCVFVLNWLSWKPVILSKS